MYLAPPGFVVGIDLGTSNTVAVIRSPDGRRRPVLFDGAPLMPSAVYLQDNGQLAIGRDAQRLAQLDPGRYEPNPKRRIDEPSVLLGDREVSTVHMLASVLHAVAVGVSEITRQPPPAVLTFPASWAQTRRSLLHDAAIAAGWPQVTLVPEPVAAARYFISALNHPLPPGSAMVVYDFGGGTIDIAVVRNDPQGFTVIGSGGLQDVGGLDIDAALVDHLGEVLKRTEPAVWARLQQPRTSQDRRDRRLFWEDVRGAKEMLSRTAAAPVSIPGVEAALHLTRDELERLIAPMLQRTVAETASVVAQCRLAPNQLSGIMLVGGSSRVPLVARMLHRELNIVPTVLEQPELPVAEGAVVHPAELGADGRTATATGSATVGGGYATSAGVGYPITGVPVSGIPVSGVPISGVPASGAPSSGMPVSSPPAGYPPAEDAPVSPPVQGTTYGAPPPTPTPRRRRTLVAVLAVVALLVAAGGVAWALGAFNRDPDLLGSWSALPAIPTELDGAKVGVEGAAAVVRGGKLYVIGGYTAGGTRTQLDSVWVLDTASRTWTAGPKLPVPLSHTSAVVTSSGALYVLGGWTTAGATDQVLQLNAEGTAWNEVAPLPEARQAGAAVWDGTVIVYGGGVNSQGKPTDTVWAQKRTGAGWDTVGKLKHAREKLGATSDGAETVWFVGGVAKDGSATETYDDVDVMVRRVIQTDAGVKVDNPREGASAVRIAGIGLCVLGGHNGAQVFDWWCQEADAAKRLPKLAVPRAGMALATAADGTIYVVGGYNTARNLNGSTDAAYFTPKQP